jgi:hypothetical protein
MSKREIKRRLKRINKTLSKKNLSRKEIEYYIGALEAYVLVLGDGGK